MVNSNLGKVKYCDYELLEQLSNDLSLDYSIATHSIFLDKTSISQLPVDFKDREKATHKDYEKLLEEKQVSKEILQAVDEENQLLGSPVINTTIGQKMAYENEFYGRGK